MKKSLLNLGKTLSKVEQKAVNGGMSNCSSYNGPICFTVNPVAGCGSCAAYQALPRKYQICVLVDVNCVEGGIGC